MVDMSIADEAVLQLLATEVRRPAVVDRTLTKALELLRADADGASRRQALEKDLAAVEAQLRNLVATSWRDLRLFHDPQCLSKERAENNSNW